MVAQLVVFAVVCISISPIVYLWVKGIDYMHKNHPDYTGDDLFGFEENKKENNEK